MASPRVSIIIPCYNGAAYVRDAIESALAQTYAQKEVIVIDDGSADGSLDIIKSYADRIRWETGLRRGAPVARNRGLEMARGDRIQFLDADDLIHPDKVTLQMESLASCGADVSCTDWDVVAWEDGRKLFTWAPPIEKDPVVSLLGRALHTASPLHSKAVLAEIGGFREDLPCSQDYDLHIRMACAGATFARVPEVMVTVRRRDDSISADYVRVLDQLSGIAWPAYRGLEEHGMLTEDRARAFAELMFRSGRHYIQRGEKARGIDYMRQAKAMHAGGGASAYSRGYRMLYRVLGPVGAEALAGLRRGIGNGGSAS